MHSVTKASVAVLLMAAVASAEVNGKNHHEWEQAKVNNRLARQGASIDRLKASNEADDRAATLRLQALLEKTRLNTEHKIAEDFARYKLLDAKLHLNLGHLDADITAKNGKLNLTKKEELLARNKIADLKARLARLNERHNKIAHDQGVSTAERAAATNEHATAQAQLSTELSNVLALKAKLQSMEKYLLDPATQQTFLQLREQILARQRKAPDAAHYEAQVKSVTDAGRTKGQEIFAVLQEFVGMLDKEIVETQHAMQRSNDHFTTTVKVLDLKDAHMANEARDVELDQKTSGDALSHESVHLLDLEHQHAMLDGEIKVAHEQHKLLEHETEQEAVAEDRKQHNLSHEHDVETTLINMLGGSGAAPVQTAFNARKAQDAAYALAAARHKAFHETKAQQEARLMTETARIQAAAQAKAAAQAARAKAAAEAEAKREAAAEERDKVYRAAVLKKQAEVEAQRASMVKAQEAGEAAARAKALAEQEAQEAADQVRRQKRLAELAQEREEAAKARADAAAAKIAAHEAAQAKVAGEEAQRKAAVAEVAAKHAAADQAHQDAVLEKHTEAMRKAEAEQAAASHAIAEHQAAQLRRKQDAIKRKAQEEAAILARKVQKAEAKAAAKEAKRQAREAEKRAAEKAARQAEKEAARQKRALDAEARHALEAARKHEADTYRQNVKAIFDARKH